jgi:hypothetical protein
LHPCMRALFVAGAAITIATITAAAPASAQTGAPATPPGYETPRATSPYGYPAPQYGTAPYGATVYQPIAPPPQAAPIAPPSTQARLVPVEHTSSIRGLWLPGLIVLPVTWVTTWTIASSAFEGDAATFAWIPIVGPWLMLTQDLYGSEAGVIVSGVVQGLAALALILGLSIKRTWVEEEYVIDPEAGVTARLRFDAISLPGGGMLGAQLTL